MITSHNDLRQFSFQVPDSITTPVTVTVDTPQKER
jgi:hypothetical protein